MGRNTQNLYRSEIDTSVRFLYIKGEEEEEHITHIDPLRRIEDALIIEYSMRSHSEGIA